MARVFGALILAGLFWQAWGQPPPRPAPPPVRESELKEEDESLTTPSEYVFNPIQAVQEIKVGDFYWKKGSHKAAALRYAEATKWNPGMGEAWLKLGEAREKLKEIDEAREAYAKYLELEPEGKKAESVKKKVERWAKQAPKKK
ncbi:MAG: tetratricopeptide repeat protein [Bryobacteraceae bacterium]|nr:tetratricopeptide repeat protein [Solibacteraceae bacterium]MCO5350728.1 tetratricopeptide repeat protein [Bryobacteraceae bacterium]